MSMDSELSILSRIFEYVGALLSYWWLIVPGGILAVEPMMETYLPARSRNLINKHWPKELRLRYVRLASILALFVASFLAFDGVNLRNRKLLADLSEARRQLSASSPSELQKRIAELEAEKNAALWAPLTADEIAMLKSQLSKIPSEPVQIICPTANCKDLTESFAKAFKDAGWQKVTVNFGGNVLSVGVAGLLMEPAEKQTDEIIAAVEKATQLKIGPPQEKRSGAFAAGLYFVIGEKPL